jgi:hypothetical protein
LPAVDDQGRVIGFVAEKSLAHAYMAALARSK